MFAIIMCKLAAFLGKLLGRGSSLPGALALKLDPNILSKITLPDVVVAVTGSNGKTSTTDLIRAAAMRTGKRVVCNTEGSNQLEGVATVLLRNCNLKRQVRADIVVLECDERFCQHIFRYFTPTHIVVTNLFRDQLTRNGNSVYVAGELKKGLPEQSVLIMNADEPVSAALAFSRDDALWFSVSAPQLREPAGMPHAYDDGAFCPLCHARMQYNWRTNSHVGDYICAGCGFARPAPTCAVTGLADGIFQVENAQQRVFIQPQMANRFFAYNIAAAFVVATEVFRLAPAEAAEALTGHTLSNQLENRIMRFSIGDHPGLFLLSKHENSMSYNGSIASILASDSARITVVLIVDLLSRKYIANDMSWLWDIDFEQLTDDRVQTILIGGTFAHDVAARLLFAGIEPARLCIRPDLDDMMGALYGGAVGDVYLMTCFTDIGKFKKRLREGDGV